jgi:hypothetical protein
LTGPIAGTVIYLYGYLATFAVAASAVMAALVVSAVPAFTANPMTPAESEIDEFD